MRIRRLRLTGFKSFVDPAELLIEPGLTGIVGPNGCGKSNLLEAIRWVMGESSARSLRGGGMDDVIFAGTERRPARDFAEVAMTLDRGGGGDEAEVVRRIERGAGSAYRIDGRDVRQKDVALLFADAATGAHSPALVSQGRIGAIIAARPAERRAMLEEAAGIAGLHVRRRDAEQKLRATEANLERLDQLLADAEGRASALRRQARAAERYRTLSTAIRLAEARTIWSRWRDAAAAADAATRDAGHADAAVREAHAAQHDAGDAAGVAREASVRTRNAAQQARDAAAVARGALGALAGEREALERRIAALATAAETLAGDRAREGVLAEDAAAAIAQLAAESNARAERIAQAEQLRPAAIERLVTEDDRLRDAEVALAQAIAADAATQAEERVARAALTAARARLDRGMAEVARVAREAAAIGDVAPHETVLHGAETAREEADRAIAAAGEALATADRARAEAATARDTAQAEAASARATLASLDGEAKALERSLPRASSDRALDRLRVAPGYERALAAALGDDLDAPVAAAGPLRWAGAAAAHDPALPPGCVPLAAHVDAPAELARRLAQIGVIEADDGTLPLATGQRLVTRDGRLRRWDGFAAEDRGAATAQGLVRRNRLAEIAAQLPAARDTLAALEAAVATATRALAEAERAGQAARSARTAGEARSREALLAADRARAAIDRVTAHRAEVTLRAGRAENERAQAALEADAAAAGIAALPDGRLAAETVATGRAAADTARVRVAELRADLAGLDRGLAADRDAKIAGAREAAAWRARAGDAAGRIAEMAARGEALAGERLALANAPAALDARIAAAHGAVEGAATALDTALALEREAEATAKTADARLAAIVEAVALAREARATATARAEGHEQRRAEASRVAGERFGCPAAVLPTRAGFEADTVREAKAEQRDFETLTRDRERLGPVNLVAEQELDELEAERTAQAAERAELGEAVARLRGSIGHLNREGRERLRAAFEAVDGHFRRLFATLFEGGEAHLALIDSDDPLEAGLEIMAQPPGKRLTSLTLLSGGEQALTACALIFALFLTNPAPICVLDEVDAPLDDANIERFCDLLDAMTRETQTRWLVVTHNAVSMARMHRLFGVTMIERGVSRLVSVDLGGAESLLAAE